MNVVVMGGRITHDVTVEGKGKKQEGVKYTNFGLAVQTSKKDEDDNYLTDFFNASAFGKTAEIIGESFAKGDYISFEGHLDASEYKDRDGNTRKYVRVIVDRVIFDASRKSAKNAEAAKKDDDVPPFD